MPEKSTMQAVYLDVHQSFREKKGAIHMAFIELENRTKCWGSNVVVPRKETPLRCYLTMEVPIKLKKNVPYNSYKLHRF